jgi:uncharacterized protein (DUF427 family)
MKMMENFTHEDVLQTALQQLEHLDSKTHGTNCSIWGQTHSIIHVRKPNHVWQYEIVPLEAKIAP